MFIERIKNFTSTELFLLFVIFLCIVLLFLNKEYIRVHLNVTDRYDSDKTS